MRPETNPATAELFWAESSRKAKRREEIAAMPSKLKRFEAILADVWTVEAFIGQDPLLYREYRDVGNRLDEWLAEDGRMPEVRAALGL